MSVGEKNTSPLYVVTLRQRDSSGYVPGKFPVTLKVQRASVGRWTECMSVGEKKHKSTLRSNDTITGFQWICSGKVSRDFEGSESLGRSVDGVHVSW